MNFTIWDTRTSIDKARYFDMYCHVIVHWQNENRLKSETKEDSLRERREEG